MTVYTKFMKHSKKIAVDLTGEKRPALNGVLHCTNGDLYATNSHVLYYGKELHVKEIKEDTIISPMGRKLDLEYPNVARIIPDFVPNFHETINVNEFIKAIDLVHVPGKVDRKVTNMLFERDTIMYKSEDITAKQKMSISMPEEDSFTSNAEYWLNALKMLKDFGYLEVEFNFYSRFRPFTLVSPDDKLTALITPIRSY